MLMHLCAGHVALLPGEFHPSKYLPQSDLGRRADSRWALPQISSFFCLMRSASDAHSSVFVSTEMAGWWTRCKIGLLPFAKSPGRISLMFFQDFPFALLRHPDIFPFQLYCHVTCWSNVARMRCCQCVSVRTYILHLPQWHWVGLLLHVGSCHW